MERLALLVPLLPLAGFLINGLVGRRLGRAAVGVIASLMVAGSFVLASLLLFHLWGMPAGERVVEVPAYSWIQSGSLKIDVGFITIPIILIPLGLIFTMNFR